MDLPLDDKLSILMSLAADDRDSSEARPLPPRLRNASAAGVLRPLNLRNIRPSNGGARRRLLRILMTNACSFNCRYCPMRRDRELPRTLLKPEELVRIFTGALQRGWCDGLFLTTGIPGRPVKVMDDLIAALELIRGRHRFAGYIHVKLVPGADAAQIERLTRLATRVSINLEAPCGRTLADIAPEKSMPTAEAALEQARRVVRRTRQERQAGRPGDPYEPGGVAGLTMQFVVGAAGDTDRQIVDRVTELYAGGGMHHSQFSAFRPIRDTPLEEHPAAPALREHRLYQVDHLVRSYGFDAREVVYDAGGNLPLAYDPKTAWAIASPERFPIDVRTASYEELVRVPGIGPTTARRIVAERDTVVFRGLGDLRRIGVITSRAAGFLTLNGRKLQDARWVEQMGFWGADADTGAYHGVYEFSPGTFR